MNRRDFFKGLATLPAVIPAVVKAAAAPKPYIPTMQPWQWAMFNQLKGSRRPIIMMKGRKCGLSQVSEAIIRYRENYP